MWQAHKVLAASTIEHTVCPSSCNHTSPGSMRYLAQVIPSDLKWYVLYYIIYIYIIYIYYIYYIYTHVSTQTCFIAVPNMEHANFDFGPEKTALFSCFRTGQSKHCCRFGAVRRKPKPLANRRTDSHQRLPFRERDRLLSVEELLDLRFFSLPLALVFGVRSELLELSFPFPFLRSAFEPVSFLERLRELLSLELLLRLFRLSPPSLHEFAASSKAFLCFPLNKCRFAVSMAFSLPRCEASLGTKALCFMTSYKAAAFNLPSAACINAIWSQSTRESLSMLSTKSGLVLMSSSLSESPASPAGPAGFWGLGRLAVTSASNKRSSRRFGLNRAFRLLLLTQAMRSHALRIRHLVTSGHIALDTWLMRAVLCLSQILKLCNNGSSSMFKHAFYRDLKVTFLLAGCRYQQIDQVFIFQKCYLVLLSSRVCWLQSFCFVILDRRSQTARCRQDPGTADSPFNHLPISKASSVTSWIKHLCLPAHVDISTSAL